MVARPTPPQKTEGGVAALLLLALGTCHCPTARTRVQQPKSPAMQFAELSQVKHRIKPGAPLPFNVRNADHTLLLARGQRIESNEHLLALFARGALVDLAELLPPKSSADARDAVRHASQAELPGLWRDALCKVSQVLDLAPDPVFSDALLEAAGPVQALIDPASARPSCWRPTLRPSGLKRVLRYRRTSCQR